MILSTISVNATYDDDLSTDSGNGSDLVLVAEIDNNADIDDCSHASVDEHNDLANQHRDVSLDIELDCRSLSRASRVWILPSSPITAMIASILTLRSRQRLRMTVRGSSFRAASSFVATGLAYAKSENAKRAKRTL